MTSIGLVISNTPEANDYAGTFVTAAGRAGMRSGPLDELSDVDLVAAIGGDGTVLEAAHQAVARDVPVVGVNLGTIGFLAEAEPDELEQTVATLAAGRYRIELRNTIQVRLPDGSGGLGINDVVVEKIDSQRLVVLDVEIDGEPFLRHRADGLVVATSTGSTAYSFSAGGPLMDPRVDGILITPVAPHSLFDRSLVIPADSVVAISVADDRSVRVSADGRELGSMNEGDRAVIEPGPKPAKFIRMRQEGFPGRVTRKFGLDSR
ncbi:MAG TPA: NAD(+)/NADH kinase [Acidimicrobiia bacterium]|nr:NAD(+)/NADH kinase [Acidimicrobiia bacterium]